MVNARELSKYVSNDSIYLSGLNCPRTDFLNLIFILSTSTIDTLYLSEYDLSEIDLQSLKAFEQIKSLHIKNCSLTKSALKAISEYTGLEHLTFEQCNLPERWIIQYLPNFNHLKSLLNNHINLLEHQSRSSIPFKDGRYQLFVRATGLQILADTFGKFNHVSLSTYLIEHQDISSIDFSGVTIDEGLISLLNPLKKLTDLSFNHCNLTDEYYLKSIRYILPNLHTLLVNGRNILDRADFKDIVENDSQAYLALAKKMSLSDFSSALSLDGKTLLIDSELIENINLPDINIFLIHHPQVSKIIFKNIQIAFWMAVVLSRSKNCIHLELQACDISDEALAFLINELDGLKSLSLKRINFSDKTQRAIFYKQSLEFLYLRDIQLASPIGLNAAIKRLELINCLIEDEHLANMIGHAKNLTELSLRQMPVGMQSAQMLAKTPGLQAVKLIQTGIEPNILEALVDKASFSSLHLRGDKLDMMHANALLKHLGLKVLDVSQSQLSGIFIRRLARHHGLQDMSFSACNLAQFTKSLIFFIAVSRVASLNLSSNQLDDQRFELLHEVLLGHEFKKLRTLDISDNPLTVKTLHIIQSLFSLNKLNVSKILLTNEDQLPEMFKTLSELNISHNQIGNTLLALVSTSSMLKKLNIVDTSINESGLCVLMQKNVSLLELNYEKNKYSPRLQDIIVKRLVINFQASIVDDARILFNHLFEQLKDEKQCFRVLKQVYDDHILKLVERNIVQFPIGIQKLNYVYGR